MPESRQRVEQITNRAIRDRNFRKTVLRANEERCAITGLRLINGGGRALSGTSHWMFDRGLVSLSDDMEILISRQANDQSAIQALINESGKLIAPSRLSEKSRLEYVQWHRKNAFKV